MRVPINFIFELKDGYVNIYMNNRDNEVAGIIFTQPVQKIERITYKTFTEVIRNLYRLSKKQNPEYIVRKDMFQQLKLVYSTEDDLLHLPASVLHLNYTQITNMYSQESECVQKEERYVMQGTSVFGNFLTPQGQYVDTARYDITVHSGEAKAGYPIEDIIVEVKGERIPYMEAFLKTHYIPNHPHQEIVTYLENHLLEKPSEALDNQLKAILAGHQKDIDWNTL